MQQPCKYPKSMIWDEHLDLVEFRGVYDEEEEEGPVITLERFIKEELPGLPKWINFIVSDCNCELVGVDKLPPLEDPHPRREPSFRWWGKFSYTRTAEWHDIGIIQGYGVGDGLCADRIFWARHGLGKLSGVPRDWWKHQSLHELHTNTLIAQGG